MRCVATYRTSAARPLYGCWPRRTQQYTRVYVACSWRAPCGMYGPPPPARRGGGGGGGDTGLECEHEGDCSGYVQ
jgi:hypothetical protein